MVSEPYRACSRDLAAHASAKATMDGAVAWSATDFRAELGRVHVPTLVMHGNSDAVMPYPGSGQRTADLVLDARTVLLPGAPHMAPVTHPDAFNDALLDFIAS